MGLQSDKETMKNSKSHHLIPKHFFCSLDPTMLLVDAVIVVTRDPTCCNTYDRKAVESWIEKNGTEPITGEPVTKDDLRPNLAMQSAIKTFINDFLPLSQELEATKDLLDKERKEYQQKINHLQHLLKNGQMETMVPQKPIGKTAAHSLSYSLFLNAPTIGKLEPEKPAVVKSWFNHGKKS